MKKLDDTLQSHESIEAIEMDEKKARKFFLVNSSEKFGRKSKIVLKFHLNGIPLSVIKLSDVSKTDTKSLNQVHTLRLDRVWIQKSDFEQNQFKFVLKKLENELQNRLPDVKMVVVFVNNKDKVLNEYKNVNWKELGESLKKFNYTDTYGNKISQKIVQGKAKKEKLSEKEYATKHRLHKSESQRKIRLFKEIELKESFVQFGLGVVGTPCLGQIVLE